MQVLQKVLAKHEPSREVFRPLKERYCFILLPKLYYPKSSATVPNLAHY